MRYQHNDTGGGSSVEDRVKGGIAFLLFIACMFAANYTGSQQWQASFIIAGILYLCTGFSFFPDTVGGSSDDGPPDRE